MVEVEELGERLQQVEGDLLVVRITSCGALHAIWSPFNGPNQSRTIKHNHHHCTVQVGGAAVALECAGRELQIHVSLDHQDEEGLKEEEDEKLIVEEEEIREEPETVCRPKRVQFSPWTPVRGSL